MSTSDVYEAVKKATVGIVAEFPNAFPKRPFTIVGTGFCLDPEGIIVTCRHVFEAFWPKQPNAVPGASQRVVAPYAMFYGGVHGKELHMFPVGIHNAVTVNKFDLCAGKVSKHPAYPDGYPMLRWAGRCRLARTQLQCLRQPSRYSIEAPLAWEPQIN